MRDSDFIARLVFYSAASLQPNAEIIFFGISNRRDRFFGLGINSVVKSGLLFGL